ncbi:MAG TPA: hypothetical protein PK176_11185 [Acidobacteriota bacterium]|nr:hypothetical protein [Acidobacteriota bacterium]HQM63867.1 hypothetical protein [Acidobacteriota bacterium]
MVQPSRLPCDAAPADLRHERSAGGSLSLQIQIGRRPAAHPPASTGSAPALRWCLWAAWVAAYFAACFRLNVGAVCRAIVGIYDRRKTDSDLG